MRPIEDVRRDLNTQSEVILLNEHFEDMPQPILEGVARLLELTQELDQELSTQITYQLEELETQERKIDIFQAQNSTKFCHVKLTNMKGRGIQLILYYLF